MEEVKAEPITADWSRRELLALRAPANTTVSQWAERFRHLTSETTARPGAWRNAVLPYLVEPMDTFSDSDVRSTTMLFATQSGKLTAVRPDSGSDIRHLLLPLRCGSGVVLDRCEYITDF